MTRLQEQFLDRARALLRDASAEDFLSFLTVREIAGGSATAQFYKAFPKGREQLLEQLWDEAAPAETGAATPVTTETVLRLGRMVSGLKDREPKALEELLAIALEDFDGYFGPGSDETSDIVCNLLIAAARRDPKAGEQILSYYQALMRDYVGVYGLLLDAVGREPIESLGGIENFAMVITALFDGLAVRARLGEPADEVLSAVLLPIIAVLTAPKGEAAPTPTELLYGTARE
jgi:hypothetical protein